MPDPEIASLARWLEVPDSTFLTSDLRRASPQFAKAWGTLERYRHGSSTRDDARRDLANCPFFRVGSTDAILDAAVARTRPGHVGDVDRQDIGTTLTLKWGPGGPPCVLLVARFANAETLGPRARLWINGSFGGTYIRTGEGNFVRAAGNTIELALCESWLLKADAFGEPLARLETTVELFEHNSDTIACFRFEWRAARRRCSVGTVRSRARTG